MNDKPDQLHRFYTKNSHYLHGVEGEETSLLQGQTAIHKKFLEIQFKECKVFIHSVDAHPSANNGIMVHVIGEMSNNSEPWRKFVQAFFLAEQQNGYFVLNDNFRYLKEESFGEEEEEPEEGQQAETNPVTTIGQQSTVAQDQSQATYSHTNGYHHPATAIDIASLHSIPPTATMSAPMLAPAAPAVSAPAPVPAPAPALAPVPAPAPPPLVESAPEPTRLPTPSPEPTPTPSVPEVVEPAQEEQLAPVPSMPSPAAPSRSTPSPTPASPAVAVVEPTQPTPPAGKPATQQTPAPAAPPAPLVPKTWASLAATNPSRWGQNVAQEAKGVSAAASQQPHAPNPTAPHPIRERPAGSPGPAAATAAVDPTMQPGGVGPRNIPPAQQHAAYAAALAITTPLCFVKGVTENVSPAALEQVLTQRFGPIKECEVVKSKACAFLEFRSIDSAKRAIIASLQTNAGGDGGIYLDEQKYGTRITVETRKERGERPAPRPRGGAVAGSGGEGRGAQGPGPNTSGTGGYQTTSRGGRGGGGGMRGRSDGVRGPKP